MKSDKVCWGVQLLTAIVLTPCTALNRLFCGFTFVADSAFAYRMQVTGGGKGLVKGMDEVAPFSRGENRLPAKGLNFNERMISLDLLVLLS